VYVVCMMDVANRLHVGSRTLFLEEEGIELKGVGHPALP
jgi:hypothetical protein